MRHSTTRHLVMAVCATAVVSVVTATGADASGHHRKHHQRMYHQHMQVGFNGQAGFNGVRTTNTIAPSFSHGNVCPGIGRSFDCKIWPPPMDEDPDRKMSGSDGT